ncbi:MAG: hypothetical protein K6E63_04000 [Lachnospiraceae bacterium]|nr:hypothetical protein [Lachnospiraceae bacterium]
MARRYRKLKVRDPKLHKKLRREAALMEAAARRARAARGKPSGSTSAAANYNNIAGVIGEAKEKTVMTDTNEAIRNEVNNEGTVDVKEAVKEVIVNNSSEGSKINALIERNNRKMNARQRKENDAEIIASMQSDDMKILAALLMDMRNKDERKLKYTKFQVGLALFTSILALAIVICVAGVVLSLLPEINNVIAQTNQVIAQTNEVINQANDILADVQPTIDNLNAVTNELANANITGMLEDVDALVVSSEKNMAEALQTVTSIDIKSLNEAIEDLSAIVSPLAGMFRR